ncbi:flagellar hook-associated protein 3 [Stutzerimonas stutzeri]|uniref:flagellar hook-associated protein 3 n=1 Tax=Stutzerimonas stutzeri TaxID=316 RepID=UPI001C4DAEB8|nr:flagellar hook-associated protein 3 [Stutzerimonas stutzeri]QXP27575.1 flagellar hook-associated protein 3 [Stutzerimonas stutzeri]
MRLSTSLIYSSSISSYQKGYANIVKTQQQISSGERIQTPADDPVGAARLLQLEQQQALLTQYQGNLTTATNSLSQEEGILNSINNLLQKARELAVEAGSGALSDEDRTSIASELEQIENQLYALMNSKDANGQYLFAGSSSGTQPYVKNPDGTYSYQGNQNSLSLQVSGSMLLSVNDSGWSVFENVVNAGRTTSALATNPNADGEQRVFLSAGLVVNDKTYDQQFRAGSPYTLELVSGSEFVIRDKDGTDVTAEVSGGGAFDPEAIDGTTITFRGITLELDAQALSSDSSGDYDALLTGYSFEFGSTADTFAISRTSSNTSTAQLSGGTITDTAAYNAAFPDSGVTFKFTSATDYEVFLQPLTATSTAIGSGSLTGSTLSFAGVSYDLSSAPAAGDSFSVKANSAETSSILDTIATLRAALQEPIASDTEAQLALRDSIALALTNLDKGIAAVDATRSSIGARLNTIDILTTENESLSITNASTQSSIRDTDMAEATAKLLLQQTMLEAAQLAFVRISQLTLFNQL